MNLELALLTEFRIEDLVPVRPPLLPIIGRKRTVGHLHVTIRFYAFLIERIESPHVDLGEACIQKILDSLVTGRFTIDHRLRNRVVDNWSWIALLHHSSHILWYDYRKIQLYSVVMDVPDADAIHDERRF